MSKKITVGDSLHVYGSLWRELNYNVRLALRLRDEVDGDMLREALRQTEKRYPYFSVHLSKEDIEMESAHTVLPADGVRQITI